MVFFANLIAKSKLPFAFLLISTLWINSSLAQRACPVNIDFELGGFQNWQTYAGNVVTVGTKNVITVLPVSPTGWVHQILSSDKKNQDPYAPIKLAAPDNTGYLVKLGNDGVGSQAERISYTFTVPNNQSDFVITYQYAVVLEDPGHPAEEQPRFTAKVYDVTANSYISCGSFDYVATANLPGFKKTGGIIYKDWTPVSINLYGYQGHQLRLEFTTADCTQGGHFGYAYIDVNNSCSQLITGNDYCPQSPTFTLSGPAGFDKYNWYNADRSKMLGTGINLVLSTANYDNKTVQLDLIPYTGFGCNYTTSTITHALPIVPLTITHPAPVCFPSTIDITTASVINNKSANLIYSYWKDATATTPLATPAAISVSGTYYIMATASTGCSVIEPVKVNVNALPIVKTNNPATVCLGSIVDLTAAAVTAGSSGGLTFTYWLDANTNKMVAKPTEIAAAGTYYIQGTNANGCSVIKPVTVTFYALPVLKTTDPPAVCYPLTVDITRAQTTAGSDANLSFSYWTNADANIPLLSPSAVTKTGTYFIKAVNSNGCEQIAPVNVIVNPLPILLITQPAAVCYPETIDLTASTITTGSTNFNKLTYWADTNATTPLARPQTVSTGKYFIKATSIYGCEVIQPVTVVVNDLPVLVITNPAKVYIPSVVDITTPQVTAGSSANLKFSYWIDEQGTMELIKPKEIKTSGTYYVKGTNKFGCFVIKPVGVTVATVPNVLVPTAFTPTRSDNNRLFPFLVGVKTFVSFKVYNHWGILVFETASPAPEAGWDGNSKGEFKFFDTFTWYAQGYDYVGNLVKRSGNTVLLK